MHRHPHTEEDTASHGSLADPARPKWQLINLECSSKLDSKDAGGGTTMLIRTHKDTSQARWLHMESNTPRVFVSEPGVMWLCVTLGLFLSFLWLVSFLLFLFLSYAPCRDRVPFCCPSIKTSYNTRALVCLHVSPSFPLKCQHVCCLPKEVINLSLSHYLTSDLCFDSCMYQLRPSLLCFFYIYIGWF